MRTVAISARAARVRRSTSPFPKNEDARVQTLERCLMTVGIENDKIKGLVVKRKPALGVLRELEIV